MMLNRRLSRCVSPPVECRAGSSPLGFLAGALPFPLPEGASSSSLSSISTLLAGSSSSSSSLSTTRFAWSSTACQDHHCVRKKEWSVEQNISPSACPARRLFPWFPTSPRGRLSDCGDAARVPATELWVWLRVRAVPVGQSAVARPRARIQIELEQQDRYCVLRPCAEWEGSWGCHGDQAPSSPLCLCHAPRAYGPAAERASA